MRKFISPATLKTAHAAIQAAIELTEKGPVLLNMYLAERELSDAIDAADEAPAEPAVRKARKRSRKGAALATTNDAQPEA